MAVIEVKKSSIEGDKEVVKSSTKKEVNELRKEVLKNEVISKKDVDDYVKETRYELDSMIIKAKEMGLKPKEEAHVRSMFSVLLMKIKDRPDYYLEKDEDYKGEGRKYQIKREPFYQWFNDLSRDDHEILIKYGFIGG